MIRALLIILLYPIILAHPLDGETCGSSCPRTPTPTPTRTPTPTATPAACNEATNCVDECDKESPDLLLLRHCFKGTCINDTPFDCMGELGQNCKDGFPDDFCG